MSLDFGYTCGKIDSCIEQMKDEVYDHLSSLLVDSNPLLGNICNLPKEVQDELQGHSDQLSDVITDLFEELRSLNEDMRSAADTQIGELNDQIADLESEIEELERE